MISGKATKPQSTPEQRQAFVSEEMADNIAPLGRIKRTRRQARLADGKAAELNAQLEVEVKFGNKQVTGVVDPLVLG